MSWDFLTVNSSLVMAWKKKKKKNQTSNCMFCSYHMIKDEENRNVQIRHLKHDFYAI